MFDPVNRIERLMQAAAADPKEVPKFYRALLDAELFVLTPEIEVGPKGQRSLSVLFGMRDLLYPVYAGNSDTHCLIENVTEGFRGDDLGNATESGRWRQWRAGSAWAHGARYWRRWRSATVHQGELRRDAKGVGAAEQDPTRSPGQAAQGKLMSLRPDAPCRTS